jgi:lipid-binding SYLF domain-containing protein
VTASVESEKAMKLTRTLSIASGLAACLAMPAGARAADPTVKEAQDAVAVLRKADPGLKKFFEKSAGYVVFPDVAKGGLVIGGAGGKGYLFEKGKAVGKSTLSQGSIGAQIGGEAFYEIIFFETAKALGEFKKGEWAMAAQVSAVAVKSGASANADYKAGVAVFTLTKGGVMAEASVGGQKFSYEPIGGKKK